MCGSLHRILSAQHTVKSESLHCLLEPPGSGTGHGQWAGSCHGRRRAGLAPEPVAASPPVHHSSPGAVTLALAVPVSLPTCWCPGPDAAGVWVLWVLAGLWVNVSPGPPGLPVRGRGPAEVCALTTPRSLTDENGRVTRVPASPTSAIQAVRRPRVPRPPPHACPWL